MSSKEFIHEVHLIDLSDDALKELLGHAYNTLKDTEEAKNNDPELARLREAIDEHLECNYRPMERLYKARLKAGRSLAKARGIVWKTPAED